MGEPIRLGLMIGPAVPIPATQGMLDALDSVEVTTTAGKASGFTLKFSLDKQSPLHTLFLWAGGVSVPLVRVVITVSVRGTTQVLMDGVMTEHSVEPGQQGGRPTFTVQGLDLTRVMDYIDFSGIPFPAMPPEARVLVMLAKYALFGVIPVVVPSVLIDTPIPIEQIPGQRGTDLQYIKRLANEVGYVFYLDPGPEPGMSRAYWGPEIKVGVPQPALNVDLGPETNCESLSFKYESDKATLPIITILPSETGVPIAIPVPPITPLNPPLGLLPALPANTPVIRGAAKYGPVKAALIALAQTSRAATTISGQGTLDVLRYGHVLKARELVGVRGAGPAFDGLYYVTRVTHTIKRGEYKQSFELARNGLVSTVPRVPP